MIAYNFSKINTRDKKVYAFADIKISSTGLSTTLIAIISILVGISIFINSAIAIAIDCWYFSPFTDDGLNLIPLSFVIGIPLVIAFALFKIPISNYRLYEFIYLYIKPRASINAVGSKVVQTVITYDAFLENQEVLRGKG